VITYGAPALGNFLIRASLFSEVEVEVGVLADVGLVAGGFLATGGALPVVAIALRHDRFQVGNSTD
jgi:hypothetical protein